MAGQGSENVICDDEVGTFLGVQQAPFSRTEKLGQSGKAKNCSSSNVYLKLSTKIKPLLLFYNLVLDFFKGLFYD